MFVIVCLLGASMYAEDRARASEASVPITMQVSLVRRIAAYDRTLRARAGDAVRIVVASHTGSAISERTAGQIARELGTATEIVGLPVVVTRSAVRPSEVAGAISTARATIVYFAPGFTESFPTIAAALDGRPVLTVSTLADDAGRGAIVAFEIDASRPRIIVNLRQARQQRIELSSQLLRLARVIQ